MMKYPLRIQISSGLGTGLILALSIGVTYLLYEQGVENEIFTHNYTTNLLLSSGMSKASSAAPWALLSLNWFACRNAIKKWRRYIFRSCSHKIDLMVDR